MKNKYAVGGRRRTPLRQFMHKVEVWLPTKTYNKLGERAMVKGRSIGQLAANVLYSALNCDHVLGWNILGLKQSNPPRDEQNEELLGKFIVATLKTGIHQDDLYMNAVDSGLKENEINDAINGLMNDGVIEFKNGIVKYKYYGKVKRSLASFKGNKIKTKEDKPKPVQLVKKLKPRS
jgi:hypothetical protein